MLNEKTRKKRGSRYRGLTLRALQEVYRDYQSGEFPTQSEIAVKVADLVSEIDGGKCTAKQIQSSVSRQLKALESSGEVIKISARQYAPNNMDYLRTLIAEDIKREIVVGRPEAFLSSYIKGNPSTATIILDISSTNATTAEAIFKRYLGENGFWVLAADHYLQLMIIGTESEVKRLYISIKALVANIYKIQNPEPVKKTLIFKSNVSAAVENK